MDYSVLNDIDHYFLNTGYQMIPTDTDIVKMYASFQKSSLYLVNVIRLHDGYRFDKALFEKYKGLTKKQFSDVGTDKVILLNLIVSDSVEDIYKDINYTPEIEDDFIDINWLIDIDEKTLVIPELQIKKLIGLEKVLPKLLGEEEIEIYELTKVKEVPFITYALIGINIILFFIMEYYGDTHNLEDLIRYGALYRGAISHHSEYWRLVSSMFIHIGVAHLAFNIFALYIFGSRLEKYMPTYEFVILYFTAGILGGGLSLVINMFMDNFVVSAGASGAIYGIVGSLFMYASLTKRHIEGLNAYFIGIYLLVGIVVSGITGGISISAHVGGFVAGMLVTLSFLRGKDVERRGNKNTI